MDTMMLVVMADEQAALEVISDAQMWSLIVGFVSPLLIAMIQQPRWAGPVRVAVTALWSVIAGGGTAWLAGDLNGRSVLSCTLVVCVTAIATYQHLWRPAHVAPWIEAKTSPPSKMRVIEGPGETEEVVVDDPRNPG